MALLMPTTLGAKAAAVIATRRVVPATRTLKSKSFNKSGFPIQIPRRKQGYCLPIRRRIRHGCSQFSLLRTNHGHGLLSLRLNIQWAWRCRWHARFAQAAAHWAQLPNQTSKPNTSAASAFAVLGFLNCAGGAKSKLALKARSSGNTRVGKRPFSPCRSCLQTAQYHPRPNKSRFAPQ